MKIGKTSILDKIRMDLSSSDMIIDGFQTKPVDKNGIVQGYAMAPLNGGQKQFARVGQVSPVKFDRFYIDLSVFETLGVMTLENAMQYADIIYMDEIGVIEKDASEFRQCIRRCLDSKKIVLGAVQRRARWFFDLINQRTDTILIEVFDNNRYDAYREALLLIKIDNKSKIS